MGDTAPGERMDSGERPLATYGNGESELGARPHAIAFTRRELDWQRLAAGTAEGRREVSFSTEAWTGPDALDPLVKFYAELRSIRRNHSATTRQHRQERFRCAFQYTCRSCVRSQSHGVVPARQAHQFGRTL